MMSFLGSIGNMMAGSMVSDGLSMVYGSNTTQNILSEKAVSRELRGHTLTESALLTKLLRCFFPEEDIYDKENDNDSEEN